MIRRSHIWKVVAALFLVVNVGGAGFAAAQGELLHAGIHVVLLPVAYLPWRLARRRDASQGGTEIPDASPELSDRLTHLEESVDAVAIEVERIGEGQRFVTRLLTESATSQAPGEGAAEPIEIKARDAAPHVRRS